MSKEAQLIAAIGTRVEHIEATLLRLRPVFAGLLGELPVVFGAINPIGFPTGGFPRVPNDSIQDRDATRVDAITVQRTPNCRSRVTITSAYSLVSATREPPPRCNTYRITITVHVEETCDPGTQTVKGTATHVTSKTWCGDATDSVKTGESTQFDGSTVDTLTYDNGTRVQTELKDGRLVITVTWPDGTRTTLTVE